MRPNVLIIAGGSGSGKSALAASIYRRFPGGVSVLHLDDYYKRPEDVPVLSSGFRNADHPDALRFDDAASDIRRLLDGKTIEISTKSELYHPDYDPEKRNRLRLTIEPRPLIIVEGFLALHDPGIRALAETSIFLSMPIDASLARRSGNKLPMPAAYVSSFLIPGHREYVMPSMEFADAVIDVGAISASDVLERAIVILAGRVMPPA